MSEADKSEAFMCTRKPSMSSVNAKSISYAFKNSLDALLNSVTCSLVISANFHFVMLLEQSGGKWGKKRKMQSQFHTVVESR